MTETIAALLSGAGFAPARRGVRSSSSATAEGRRNSAVAFIGLLLVLAAAVGVYRGALSGYFVQDDFPWLAATRFAGFGEFSESLFRFHPAHVYRPLSQEAFFWLGQRAFGLNAFPFHVVNMACHLGASTLLFVLLRSFFPPVPALAGTLFYAAHSAHFRSLYWIAAVSEPLAVFFFLAAAILFLRFLDGGKRWFLVAALVAMLLGVGSKETILPLPAVLTLACAVLAPRRIQWTLPFWGVTAACAVARVTSSTIEMSPYPLVFGNVTWKNLQAYVSWTGGFSESLLKVVFGWNPETVYAVSAASVAALLTALAVICRGRRIAALSLGWFAITAQTFLYFDGQAYAYYLAPSLAGLSLLVAGAVDRLDGAGRWGRGVALVSAGLFLAAAAASVSVEGKWWNERSYLARDFLNQLVRIDREHPDSDRVYLDRLSPEVVGAAHYPQGLEAVGLSRSRYVRVGLENPLTGDVLGYFDSGGARHSRYYVYRRGLLEDRTQEFRSDPLAYLAVVPEGYLPRPDVRLLVSATEVEAGTDSFEIQITGLDAPAIDVLYSVDGRVPPPVFRWALDRNRTARVDVDAATRRGLYRFLALRDSRDQKPDRWIRIEAAVRVR